MSKAIMEALEQEIRDGESHNYLEWRIVISPQTIENYMIDRYNAAVEAHKKRMAEFPMFPVSAPDFNHYVKPVTDLKLYGYRVRFDSNVEKPYFEKFPNT